MLDIQFNVYLIRMEIGQTDCYIIQTAGNLPEPDRIVKLLDIRFNGNYFIRWKLVGWKQLQDIR